MFIYMKNYTILLFSGDLSKICWTKQDIRKFNGELFDVHVFLNSESNCQSVAFNPLATYCLLYLGMGVLIVISIRSDNFRCLLLYVI